MKPKNKFQREVVEASKKLPPLTKKQIEWGHQNTLVHIGRRTQKGIVTCTACSHAWEEKMNLKKSKCPNCKTKIHIKTTRKRVFKDCSYMTIITAHKGFQVIRTVMMKSVCKVGKMAEYVDSEVMQRWIAPNGKHCTFARLRQTMGTIYYDNWLFQTDLELRTEYPIYNRMPIGDVYPSQKFISELKRTGIVKYQYTYRSLDFYKALLQDSRMETLLKSGYVKLFESLIKDTSRKLDDYWCSIRICIRNWYEINDPTLWLDYIDYLRLFGKDLHNANYVCPSDLKIEHDRYMKKKAKIDVEKEMEKLLEKEDEFRKVKERFFGLKFTDGQIQVQVLESIKEILLEGKLMHHCVGKYYSKEDSLILSASMDGKKIETIELSISKLEIIQCRGLCNEPTKYHNRIVKLVEKNLPLIGQRIAA